jgi:DNA repair protein RadC
VLLHDHTSETVSPSAKDREVIQRIAQVGEVFGIRVLEHILHR